MLQTKRVTSVKQNPGEIKQLQLRERQMGACWAVGKQEGLPGLMLSLWRAGSMAEGQSHSVKGSQHTGVLPVFSYPKDITFPCATIDLCAHGDCDHLL